MKQYDIFISYRRDTGQQYARILQMALEKIGYRVFLDYDEIKDGVFGDNIRQAVIDAPIFMPVLSSHYLVRCKNEGDWVREEIMLAIEHNKHFVPVNPDGQHDGIPNDIPQEIISVISDNQHSEIMLGKMLGATLKLMVDERIRPHVKPHRMFWTKNVGLIVLAATLVVGVGAYLAYNHIQNVSERQQAFVQCKTKVQYEDFIRLYPNTAEAVQCKAALDEMKLLKNDGRAFVCNTGDEDVRQADKQMIDNIVWDSDITLIQLRAITDIFNCMMLIPSKDSIFTMGRVDEISYDGPQHSVTLTEDFYMCQYEVTRGWWYAVMNDSLVADSAHYPIANVTCEDARKFTMMLRYLTGISFSLPTEAQWEWAAIGNTSQAFAGSDDARQVAWFESNADRTTHEVGTVDSGNNYFSCNDHQLYDMSGNVAEWCMDYMSRYPSAPQVDPCTAENPGHGKRVVRGGSILTNERDLNVRHRAVQSEDIADKNIGFRVIFKK